MLRTRAQSLVEYAILIVAVIGVVVAAIAILTTVLTGLLNGAASNVTF
jgi:hypothetical protein